MATATSPQAVLWTDEELRRKLGQVRAHFYYYKAFSLQLPFHQKSTIWFLWGFYPHFWPVISPLLLWGSRARSSNIHWQYCMLSASHLLPFYAGIEDALLDSFGALIHS